MEVTFGWQDIFPSGLGTQVPAKRLILWLKSGKELSFIFVNYKKTDEGLEILGDSGLIPVYQISWNCLTIEAQGWGVIQMYKPLEIDTNQTLDGFLKGMKVAYEKYMKKESKKMAAILKYTHHEQQK